MTKVYPFLEQAVKGCIGNITTEADKMRERGYDPRDLYQILKREIDHLHMEYDGEPKVIPIDRK